MSRLAVALVTLALLVGCGARDDRPKVAIFCLDGATFTVIDRMFAEGELPHLRSLVDRGAHGVLVSDDPPKASPVLWATIFSGTSKETHGIEAFTKFVDGEPRVYTSGDWKVQPLWQLVEARGGTAGIVGPLNTWPAEELEGYMVSDRFARSPYGRDVEWSSDMMGMVSPHELSDELLPLVHDADALTREELAPFGTFSDGEWHVMMHADEDAPTLRNGLLALRYGYSTQRTNADVATHMLAHHEQPDLFAVFLELPDRAGHHFWDCYEPHNVVGGPERVFDDWLERWDGVVPEAYAQTDAAIGEMLALLDEDTTVFVVSDHGMQSAGTTGTPARLLSMGSSGKHHRHGVFVAAGPAIVPGAAVDADLWNVAPTVLAALGLPPSTQFEQGVVPGILSPEFVAAHPQGPAVDDPPRETYDPFMPERLDDVFLEQLQAMGYIDEDGVDR